MGVSSGPDLPVCFRFGRQFFVEAATAVQVYFAEVWVLQVAVLWARLVRLECIPLSATARVVVVLVKHD